MNKLFIAFLLIVLVVPIEVSAMAHPVFGPKTTALRTTAGTRFFPFFGGALNDTNTMFTPVGAPGVVSSLTAQVTSAPGVGNSYVVALYRNGSITGLTCTIADAATSCTDTTNTVLVVAGDNLNWSTQTVGTTGASQITIAGKFDGYSTYEATIGGTSSAATNTDGYYPVVGGTATTTESSASVIAPSSFTLDKLYCRVTSAPGAGTSFAYTLYINGSPTSLGCTISGTGTADSDLSDSVSVAVGDTLSMQLDVTGAASSRTHNWGMRLRPTTIGEYPLMAVTAGIISTTLTQYSNPWAAGSGNSNETTALRVSPLAFVWKNLYAFFNPAPGSGKSWTMRSRVNSADGAQTAVVSNTSQITQDTTNSDSVALGDSIAYSSTPSGTPNAVVVSKFSSVSYVAPTSSPLLLDEIAQPSFAFSLSRYLRVAEKGNPVVRLRESATQNQLDFKLNGSNVLVSNDSNLYTVSQWRALTSATTSYIVSIYDQSGNGRTFTQADQTRQPTLTENSGLNGLAAIDNNTLTFAGFWLNAASSFAITPANGIEVHLLIRPVALDGTTRSAFGSSAASLAYVGGNTNGWVWQADLGEVITASTSPSNNTNYQMAWRYVGASNYIINQNGTEIMNYIHPGGTPDWRTGIQGLGSHGSATNANGWPGLIAEGIFYNGVYSANDVDDIELSQQTHGGLYTAPSANILYRAYNLGKMLLNNGTFILR